MKLEELQAPAAVRGIVADSLVSAVSGRWIGVDAMEPFYRTAGGELGSQILYREDEARLEIAEQGRWGFDGDGDLFRVVSEALRIRLVHLFDPALAVHTSLVEPLPHQSLRSTRRCWCARRCASRSPTILEIAASVNEAIWSVPSAEVEEVAPERPIPCRGCTAAIETSPLTSSTIPPHYV